MKSQALAPQTGRLIEAISRLECIKPFVLVGGTALSIQLKTRQSEDLDFMRWKESKDDTLDIGWPKIQNKYANGSYGATNFYYTSTWGSLYTGDYPTYDNTKAILQTGFMHKHNIAVQAGNDKMRYHEDGSHDAP